MAWCGMTVGVAIRVPGVGAVLVCDSRVSDSSGGKIYTDSEQKFGVFGTCTAIYAGRPGSLWIELRDSPPRNWPEVYAKLTDTDARAKDRDYEVLVYDRTQDRVIHTDASGYAVISGTSSTIGCGGELAQGVIDGARAPATLEAAAALALRACRAAVRRNAFCGGRLRLVVSGAGRRGKVTCR